MLSGKPNALRPVVKSGATHATRDEGEALWAVEDSAIRLEREAGGGEEGGIAAPQARRGCRGSLVSCRTGGGGAEAVSQQARREL